MINFDNLLNNLLPNELKIAFDEIKRVPEGIKVNELKLFGLLNKEIMQMNQDKRLKEKFYIEVTNEVGEEGKKLYSNEKLREIEADKRFLSSEQHLIWASAVEDTQKEINMLKVEIDYLKREFKAIEFVIEINKSRVKFT